MKAAWLIWIGALTAPLGAANGQGLRVEALAGYDTDGYQNGALLGARAGYDFRVAPNVENGIDGEYNDITSRQRFAGSPLVIHYGPELYVVAGRPSSSPQSRAACACSPPPATAAPTSAITS
jgi:hypothetical protein